MLLARKEQVVYTPASSEYGLLCSQKGIVERVSSVMRVSLYYTQVAGTSPHYNVPSLEHTETFPGDQRAER